MLMSLCLCSNVLLHLQRVALSKVTTVTLYAEQHREEHSPVPLIAAGTAHTQGLVLCNRPPTWRKKPHQPNLLA